MVGALSQKIIEEKSAKLKEWIWENDSEIPRNRLSLSNDCVLNIIDLVERRRVYFHVFHGINIFQIFAKTERTFTYPYLRIQNNLPNHIL